ncbi:MAG: tetratricopeptide repeat protein [Armatimonadota bacterium]|nr:tetratricopeptide repeat protein [Armatimonadota bacterium]
MRRAFAGCLFLALLVAGPAATAVAQAPAPATTQAQPLPVFNTSRLYLTEEDFNRAIQPYQVAIRADARNARAHYWLGVAHVYAYRQHLGGAAPYAAAYLDKAISSLEEAIKLSPGMLEAYMQLQDAYHLKGDLARANEVVASMLQRTRPSWLPAVPAPPK